MIKWLGDQGAFVSLIWPAFILPWIQEPTGLPSGVSRGWAPWEPAQASITVEGRSGGPLSSSRARVRFQCSVCFTAMEMDGQVKVHRLHDPLLSFCPRETHMRAHMCTHTYTQMHTHAPTDTDTHRYIYTHTHLYTHIQSHLQTYTHTHIHKYTQIYIHTYTHIRRNTHTFTHLQTCTYTYMHTHIHIHTDTYTDKWIHTYTHVHTYTNIQIYTHITHLHKCTHRYTRIYIHVYTLPHIHLYIHIYTQIYTDIHTHTTCTRRNVQRGSLLRVLAENQKQPKCPSINRRKTANP